jgi:hypothetical protein
VRETSFYARRRKRADALEAVPLLSPTSPVILCAKLQPQQPSVTMMMLLLHPLSLVSLMIRARDQSLSSSDDIGRDADTYRSAVILLLLQAALNNICGSSDCSFPPTCSQHKVALIPTMRRIWLLESAIGAQSPPSSAAFNVGPESEFDFLAARLGLNCDSLVGEASIKAADVMQSLVHTVFDAAAASSAAKRLYWPIGLPLQPSFHLPPDSFSDLLVACIAPCSCRTVHRAAALCL